MIAYSYMVVPFGYILQKWILFSHNSCFTDLSGLKYSSRLPFCIL